jgi:hypothetical protein
VTGWGGVRERKEFNPFLFLENEFLCSPVMICLIMEKYELVNISSFARSKNYIFELINGPSMIFIG